MRLAPLLIAALLLAGEDTAFAAGQRAEYTGASNTGDAVSVRVESVSTSGAGAGSRRGGGPRVDPRAVHADLFAEMSRVSLREIHARTAESYTYQTLRGQYARCAALARHFEAESVRRVPVETWVAETHPYTTWELRPFTTHAREPVRIRLFGRTITVWRTVTRVVYRQVPVTRYHVGWVKTTRWVTLDNPAAVVQASLYRRCADSAYAAMTEVGRRIQARRSAWDAEWADLKRRAHESWKDFNTSCQTIRQIGDRRVQRCSYGAWENYSPGSFERTIVVTPPRPPQTLISQAADEVRPPSPVIGMNPRVEWEQIVNFPSWMWIDPSGWQPKTARAEAGEAWAQATATPDRVIWDMGNGDQVVCRGPGAPYDEGRHESRQRTDCSYTYRRSSAGQPGDAYTVTATLVYDVAWQGSGGAGGDLGTLSRSSTASVRVAELQALVTDTG